MPEVHAMPIAHTEAEVIGYQAQCRAGDWNSVTHNHREHAQEDAELHKRYYHHNVAIVPVAAPTSEPEGETT